MGFAALRSTLRSVSTRLLLGNSSFPVANIRFQADLASCSFIPFRPKHPWITPYNAFHSLTDTRCPKRRPCYNPGRKRSSMKPPGPYAWVKCVPGEPILPNQPNEGSVKRRKAKLRIKQQRAFIMSEKRKRKAQMQEANRKKIMKRVEKKMAAVAREKAWAERLIELKRIEAEKKQQASMA